MKLATALNVSPTALWPGVEVQQILDAIDRVQDDQVMSAAEAEALQAALNRPSSRIEVARLPIASNSSNKHQMIFLLMQIDFGVSW